MSFSTRGLKAIMEAKLGRCAALFDCLREAVRGLAAATALFFGVAVVGTALMLSMGGG